MLDGNLLPLVGLGASSLVATTAGLGLMLSPWLQKKVFPKPQESHLSDLLPFHHLAEDSETLVCKDGSWCKTILLEGCVEGTQSLEERLAYAVSRRQWLDVMAKGDVTFTMMTHRQPVQGKVSQATYDHPILQKLSDLSEQQFLNNYKIVHYLLLNKKPKAKPTRQDLQSWKEATQNVFDYLQRYQPRALRQTEQDNSLLSFWSHLINGFSDHPVSGTGSPFCTLSRELVSSTVSFDYQEGIIEWRNGQQKMYGAVVSVHRWNDILSDRLMRHLLELPCELRFIHWLKGLDVLKASSDLKLGLDQSLMFFFNAHIQSQFKQAQEWIQSEQNSLYEIQTCLFLQDPNKDTLLEMVDRARAIFRTQGLKPSHETHAVEGLWLNQFPSFNKLLLPNRLFSQNIAGMTSFTKDQEGWDSCDWGSGALRQFKTSNGGAYQFQMHVSSELDAVAHSLVLAPSGGGKTTLFQHLIGGALKHRGLQAYIFDRYGSSSIFTRAVGGSVIDLGDAGNLSLNPLQCEETESNRAFLREFLLQLSQTNDEESEQEVGRAVDYILKLPLHQRNLDVLCQESVGLGCQLKDRLEKWTTKGTYGRYFNGAKDALDISNHRLINFEMGQLQDMGGIYPVMLRYIVHRIREQISREALPHFMFIDESAPLLEDTMFRNYVKQFFREHRRLRGSITVCFQDATAVMQSDIRDTILNQCQTVFFFPNANAKKTDFDAFSLNDQEWGFIKGTKTFNLKRGVLVKRTTPTYSESVFLDIDLSHLGPHLKLYRSGKEAINTVNTLREQFPDNWIPDYIGDLSC